MDHAYPIVTLQTALEHGLSEQEYGWIREILGRVPTYVELGLYSVMWSEHCSYKNSILELKRLPRKGRRVLVSAGEENAGVLDIGDGLGVCFKIESHNHPSAVEPYQGAATGVGGILRDIFTMGARPIAALNSLRFGALTVPRNRELLRGVVRGIADYGNCFGVPTVGGEVYFDSSYDENPLVNAMAVGIVEHGKMARAAAEGPGNPVFVVGAATGRDGIHGATFASEELSEKSEQRRPSVQIGDPFKEKLLLEATLELIESGVLVGIQDMGAAGITCSCTETAARGKSGIRLDVDRVTRREESMTAYEVCLSESQERMLAIIRRGGEGTAKRIFAKWDIHADEVGTVSEDDRFVVHENGQQVADVPAAHLVLGGGAPEYRRPFTRPRHLDALLAFDPTHLPEPDNFNEVLEKLLASPNIASKRWIYEQYDHTIGANTRIGGGRCDAAILRVPGTRKGLALTVDCNSRYVAVDPQRGAALAVFEGARNVACAGARPIGITNCLNFGSPMNPETYYFFHEAVTGIAEACRSLDIPVTGGNVSFYNETRDKSVLPTPVIGMVGLIEDVDRTVAMGFKDEGDFVALLGTPGPDIGASEFLSVIHGTVAGAPPRLDMESNLQLIELLAELADLGLVKSAHDLSEGGLAVTVAEMCIAGKLGCVLTFPWKGRAVESLFAESAGCVVVSVEHGQWSGFRHAAERHSVPVQILGRVGGDLLVINDWIAMPVEQMEEIYEGAIPFLLGEGTAEYSS
ncbi:phosphoribosylformylglycinamidine synthase subunit PurL [bacterium]|nr:phosphoribosylformylglycinamidine synthase subunit PurL [bacterium]MBU1983796.1 phosphoribosylformylglycinamidine synthase subunit PurL [bacterium]